jgi:hypothetical protein
MSQFLDSNPAARPPQGPKRGPWRRELAATWQEALGLSAPESTEEADDTRRRAPDRKDEAAE